MYGFGDRQKMSGNRQLYTYQLVKEIYIWSSICSDLVYVMQSELTRLETRHFIMLLCMGMSR